MNPEQLPKVDNEEYKPNLEAQDEEVVSGGSNRLTYILVALVVALIVGYVALPKGNGSGISSVTPSFMLDDAAVVASASDTVAANPTDSIAAAFDAAAPGSDLASDPSSTSTENAAPAGSASSFDEPINATRNSDRPATSSRTTTRGGGATTPGEVAALSPVTASSESASESSSGSVSAPTTVANPSSSAAPSATVIMSGHIADENGRPLVGATVLLKGSTKGTSTDASGNYSIEVPTGGDNTLVFGYAGYDDEIVRGTGSKFANVILTPRAKPSKKGQE
ncbi:MAG TPA: carboxypeptidase-like regulatory domain-containing protein [Hymenobacter sp.]